MESGSSEAEADRFEDDEKTLHERSNINRRDCTGIGKLESKRNQLRHSWHNIPPMGDDENSKIWSYENYGKKRKMDTEEVGENLKTEEMEICKRAVHEAIFRLNGKDVDLKSYTLLELVTQLSEEQENIVNKISREGSEKISSLEDLLSDRQLEVDRLSAEKNELDSLLKAEHEKYVNADDQLKVAHLLEAVNKLDNLSKELEEIIAQSLKETEKINLQLEQERLKASTFEFSLEEKNQQLEKLIQKQKELELLMDANDAKAKNDIKTLLNRIDIINSEKLEVEEREYKVKCDMKKCKEELMKCKKKISSLTSINEEFDSLISLEKKSSQEMKCQLQVTLDKVDSLSKELADSSDKSSRKEKELLLRLNDGNEKVVKLGDELHSKIVALENLNVMLEEHKLQLNEERTNSKMIERDLKEAILKNVSLIEERLSVKLSDWAEDILALRGQLEYCLIYLSNVQPGKNEAICLDTEDKISHDSDYQFSSLLKIIETVSGKMNDLSEKLEHKGIESSLILKNKNFISYLSENPNHKNKNVEDHNFKTEEFDVRVNEVRSITEEKHEEELHVNKNALYKSFSGTAEEQKLGETLEVDFKKTSRYNIVYGDKKADLICKCSDQENVNGNVSLKCREMISSLEIELEKSKAELNSITTVKYKYESTVEEERKKLQNSDKELKNALNEIETLTKSLTEMICNDANKAARLKEEMERYKQLEEELEASEVVVANLAVSEEEVTLQLKEMIEHRKSLEEGLKEAQEKTSILLEENQRIKHEMAAREKERIAIAYQHGEKLSRFEAAIYEYKSQLYKISCDKTELETSKEIESTSELMEFREMISELEKIIEGNASDISRLGIEKGELVSLLELEKENCQQLSSQLSIALENQEISSKKIYVYEQKLVELEELAAKNSSEISSLAIERGELESMLISEKESCQKILAELRDALLKLGSFSDKISVYEQKIAELEEVLLKNASDISRLGKEKGELESFLCSEKENSQNLSSRLTEALEMLDNVTKQLEETSTREKDSDEVSFLIDVGIQNMRKLEKQNENKDEELLNSLKKAEELKITLNNKNCKIEELEMKLLKLEADFQNANSSEFHDVMDASESISEYKKKISKLEEIVTWNESVFSRIKAEKGELELLLVSEKKNQQKISLQLNEALVHLDNVTQKLIEFSARDRYPEELPSLLDIEIEKVRRLEEELESKKWELEKITNEMEGSNTETMNKISGYEVKVAELEELAARNESDISRLEIEKEELESQLISEKENCQKLSFQLNEAVVNLEKVTKESSLSSAKNEDVEKLSSLLDMQVKAVKQLEEELVSKNWELEKITNEMEGSNTETMNKISGYEVKVAELEELAARNESDISRLEIEKEELESQLISEKENCQKLSFQLNEAVVNLEKVTKESSLSSAKNEDVEKLSSLLDMQVKAVKQLEEELVSKNWELEKITNEMEGSNTETMNKISGYEVKVAELEELAARNESDISRLEIEKEELESQLISEKENCQKLSFQLNEAVVNLEKVTKESSLSSAKNEDVEKLSSLLDMQVKAVKQLEEELVSKNWELEKITNEMEGSNTETMNKISGYEVKVAELEELAARNESDISRLEIEKEELESQLISEKENCQKLSFQLNEAVVNLEKVTKESSLSSAKNEDVEKLSSLLDMQVKAVKQLEEELVSKNWELEKITNEMEGSNTETMNKISGYEVKVAELEELAARNESDISRLEIEKEELESQLISEKENCQKISFQLNEAVVNIENITKELNESSAKNANVEELEFRLHAEIQKVRELHVELKTNDNILQNYKDEQEKLKFSLTVEEEKVRKLKNELETKVNDLEKLVIEVEEYHSQLRQQWVIAENKDLEIKRLVEKPNSQEVRLNMSNDMENVTGIKISEPEASISKLESLFGEIKKEKDKITAKNIELESCLHSEKEISQALNTQLRNSMEMINKDEQMETLKNLLEMSKSQLLKFTWEKDEFVTILELKNNQIECLQIQLANSSQEIDTLTNKLNEVSYQVDSRKDEESEVILSIKAELECAKYALSVCVDSEEELDNLLSVEKSKVSDLCKQLSEEKAKRREVISKNMELANAKDNIEEQLSLLVEDHRKCSENEMELRSKNEELSTEVATLKVKLCSSELVIEKLKAELTVKVNDIPAMQQRNKELTEQLEVLNNLLEESRSELSSVTVGRNELVSNLELKNLQLQSVQHQLQNSLQEIDSLTKSLNEVSDQFQSNKIKESEVLFVKAELESAKCALLDHIKSKEEFDNSLSIERTRVEDLRKKLLEERAKREEEVSKNMELTDSIKTIEQRLASLLDDYKKCHENELKLMSSNGELSAEITGLEAKLNSCKSETEKLEAECKIKVDDMAQSEKRNIELSSMLELRNKKINELEVFIKELNGELSLKVTELNNGTMKISQLQSALENAQGKIQSMSSEVRNLKEVEDSLRADISQLGTALIEANEKIRNINEARVYELEKEKIHSKGIISQFKNQSIAANNELKAVLKLNEGKISSLEYKLKAENEKFAQKVEEVKLLQLNGNELSELLKVEKNRVSILENKILKNEEKFNILEKNLESIKAEINEQVKKNDRLKNMEVVLRSEIELEKKKNLNAENELTKLKTSLCLSGMKQDELKLKINCLETRLQEESSLVTQLKSQLVNEKEALSAAREAEKSILGVVSAQEKALSLLEANKEVMDAEIRMLNGNVKEKDEQLRELTEKLDEQEEYSKSMERMMEKLERRNGIVVDHRIEIQNEAKAKEDKLRAEIAELRGRLDKEMVKSGSVRGDFAEFKKELESERSRKKEVEIKLHSAMLEVQNYHSQIEEYKRELMRCKQLIFGGVKGQDTASVNKATLINCGIQTIPMTMPQVQQTCLNCNGAGQGSKIDFLELKVKSLEDDKEFLKKICRRRHEQREELKLQLDTLISKTQPGLRPKDKGNLNSNT